LHVNRLFRSTAGMPDENRCFTTEAQRPKTRSKKKTRRTRFGEDKQNIGRPHPVPHTLHPDDLPQRARWTIIITAGLLLITCMLLVGVTLRMAPVIDELGKRRLSFRLSVLYWLCIEVEVDLMKIMNYYSPWHGHRWHWNAISPHCAPKVLNGVQLWLLCINILLRLNLKRFLSKFYIK